MKSSVFREGMPLPTAYQPAPSLEGVFYLQAVHGKGWVASSYFVERDDGNILVSPLVYSEELGDFIEARGGIDFIFITHRDEIELAVLSEVGRDGPGEPPANLPACQHKARFQCRIAAHAADAFVQDECQVDLAWSTDYSPMPGLQFIHTPGHTPGSACLLLDTPAGRLMFCGDSVALDETGKISAEFEPEEAAELPSYLENWSKITVYDFDALIPLHTLAGSPVPYIAQGGKAALKTAYDEVTALLSQFGPAA